MLAADSNICCATRAEFARAGSANATSDNARTLSVIRCDDSMRASLIASANLLVERRFANGRIDRLDVLAAELIAARVDIIYAPPTPAVLAAMKASTTVPIVFSMLPDPVKIGLVKSLAWPGGNATGLSTLGSGLVPKRIELIH